MYYLAQLEPPFNSDVFSELQNQIINKKPKVLPHFYSVRLKSFIELCLSKGPNQRPTASEALAMFPSFAVTFYQKNILKV